VVVLTERLKDDLAGHGAEMTVVPCAVDLDAFAPPQVGQPQPYDLVYAGSWSGLYLSREMLAFFEAYRRRRPEARLLVLTPGARERGEAPSGIEFRDAFPDEVPALLRTARAGLSFRRPGRAQRAASPVKVSEYLACGLPVVSSAGVGDLDELLPRTRTGLVVPGFSAEELDRGAHALCALLDEGPAVAERCRGLAEERFGLPAAIEAYDRAYRAALALTRAA
jgi:glycosyltransferase involved in cell wall biosynthesis